ncbi:MAG TPA: M1 family metallopeptidase [Ferruginibacter sp.]|nr:M1 family metallopeptidase [Bacteroidota bacterium]MBS1926467.1 M1 family metallopeptidase [Bacteroidota bacterium]HMT96570.1 M1 family metallopeptidase [Ferruginibacter sp.]HMU23413.1 M1 family metallopeptidase [Ferruginibacter sp.]
MKRILLLVVLLISFTQIFAQFQEPEDTSWKHIYRETAAITNNLVHTKLEVKFDFDKSWMYGKEWLTLQPHFYATDSVRLDAKGMDIKEVALVTGAQKKPLQYKYDGHQLNIKLDKSYAGGEKYTLYFDYISKPNDYKTQGSMAITDAKGLYFINPKGEEKDKPTQIWTQGETEANSVWMVTIDKPNQKTTEEIYMTVPSRFTTLSNGLKISEKKNADGSRTDYWKMDLPHAPYLFFMGVGEYSVVKDKPYKGKEVSYYVEPSQAPYAKGVFGNTPEMIAFFSDKLGVDFPWPKYAQIVGRDYVSGAMENTTATLHQESAYQNNRQLLDGNHWEETIAHELFHQWFGDLVTTESWSNITVNESFANYSEYLWDEYKYGKDFADEHNFEDMSGYLMSGSNHKDLVRFYYSNKEDVFDAVSYNKGGRILHMLRNYVGDDAFFKSLNNYLTTNKFKTGEAQQLRLAFEEVTGKDLNWFFNQWYYGSGQPKLKIDYDYSTPGIAKVKISQIQKDNPAFILPIAIDVYNGPNKVRHNVWVRNLVDSFSFPYTVKPDLINVDGDKILLAEKIDNKSEDEFKAQWMYAKNYLDRKEALDFFAKKNMPEIAKGLYDKYSGLRTYSIQKISGTPYKSDKVVLEEMERIAKSDFSKKTRAAAIKFLSKNGDASNKAIFEQAVNDSSYSVAGAGLSALAALDPDHAYTLAKKLNVDSKGALREAINSLLYSQGKEEDFDLLSKSYNDMGFSFEKLGSTSKFAEYLSKLNNFNNIKKGIDDIITFYNAVPEAYKDRITPLFKSSFDRIIKSKGQEAEDYIKSVFK